MLARSGEERKTLRRFTRRAATLIFGDQRPSVDCVIWDLSKRQCEVVWMDKRFVGPKFTRYVL